MDMEHKIAFDCHDKSKLCYYMLGVGISKALASTCKCSYWQAVMALHVTKATFIKVALAMEKANHENSIIMQAIL